MTKGTLIQIEASGIQDYIFGCNNLQQNIGASELVSLATTLWIADILDQMKLKNNARWDMSTGRLNTSRSGAYQARILYASSGAALLWIADGADDPARGFIQRLTRKVLEQARGLNLLVESIDLAWETDVLSEKHGQLRKKTAKRKLNRQASFPLPGLSITAFCTYTGQPVVGREPKEGHLISKSVECKLGKLATGNEHLHRVLPQVRRRGLDFIYDFDQIGERGESSYLAVVHLDGNNMGSRFREIIKAHPLAEDNEAYAEQLGLFSEAVKEQSMKALSAVVDLLIENIQDGKIAGEIPIPQKEGLDLLQFRPIVFGGDDITFICEGHLGLPLAARFLEKIAAENLPGTKKGETGTPLYARAGVAIVKNHYPFSRAYELAKDLCQLAKKALGKVTPEGTGCVLDWQISKAGMVLDLPKIRVREYSAENGDLMLMRPLRVDADGQEVPDRSYFWRSWQNFQMIIDEFKTNPDWAEHRNKTIDLQDHLRKGDTAVKQFLLEYDQPQLPEIPKQESMKTRGWNGKECGYYDALEALDFYVPLKKGEAQYE